MQRKEYKARKSNIPIEKFSVYYQVYILFYMYYIYANGHIFIDFLKITHWK